MLIICEDAFRAPSMLALEMKWNDTAVMLKVFRDGCICILGSEWTISVNNNVFFVKMDAPQSRGNGENQRNDEMSIDSISAYT